jgi:hypothetical protein
MWRRLEHTVVLAVAIELAMVIAFNAIMLTPRWTFQAFAPTANGDHFHPKDWSSDGSALLTAAGSRFEVLRSDGSVLRPDVIGSWPVWIDDRRVVAIEAVEDSTFRLIRLDTFDGSREVLGEPLVPGSLIADGHGRVAHQSVIGDPVTSVLDPMDGHVVARLTGYRARTWTDDGALLVRRPDPQLGNIIPGAGALFIWRPGATPRPLAPDLVDLGEVAPLSPSGEAVACVCAATSPAILDPVRALFRVPIDGSKATRLASWRGEHGSGQPDVAWLSETSLAVIDGDGLSRVDTVQGNRTIAGLSASELGFERTIGRVYALGDTVVAILQDQSPPGWEPLLVVVDGQDRVRLQRVLGATNLPVIAVDRAQNRGVVSTDPQVPGEPPVRFFVLEFR